MIGLKKIVLMIIIIGNSWPNSIISVLYYYPFVTKWPIDNISKH